MFTNSTSLVHMFEVVKPICVVLTLNDNVTLFKHGSMKNQHHFSPPCDPCKFLSN
jgi:hypothetical protein